MSRLPGREPIPFHHRWQGGSPSSTRLAAWHRIPTAGTVPAMDSLLIRYGTATAAAATLLAAGCQSPSFLDDSPASKVQPSLRAVVDDAIDQEIGSFAGDPGSEVLRRTEPYVTEVEKTLADRREELDQISPAMSETTREEPLGPDLVGNPQGEVRVGLEEIVRRAVANNLGVKSARIEPAINREEVIRAQAVFDYVLFAGADLASTDEPTVVPVINSIPLGTPYDVNDRYRFETGIRRRSEWGGVATLSTDLTRFSSHDAGIDFDPDPAYSAAVRLGLVQPLMRGFGRDVNTASIRIAENAASRSVAELERDLLNLVEDTERAYWTLVFSWRELEVRMWLVEVGEQVRDVLAERRAFDTRLAQYADAVATVERRKSEVIRAQRAVRRASDSLKSLLNDPALSIGSESILHPTDDLMQSPVDYNLRETMITALDRRPEIRAALLVIDDTEIAQLVADNMRLPILDLRAEVAWLGLDDGVGGAYSNTTDGKFMNYVLGAFFELPLGNREADAAFRQARLRRTRALLGYRQTVESVILDVKSALRDVIANYELIQASRSSRVAQAENLRALLVEEEMLAGLTPEFLNLKFQQQERLASARAQELASIAAFDASVAQLHRAMGTGLDVHRISLDIVEDPTEADALALPGWAPPREGEGATN